MIDSQVVAFTVVAAALTVSPGADTLLVVRNVLRGGRRDGIVTTFGICSGLFVHATLSAVGVSMLLMHSATAFYLVKIAGAGYLAWLGLQSLANAVRGSLHPGASDGHATPGPVARRRCFLEGFLTNLLNPKVAVFYLALLPQFIGPTDPVFAKSLLLAAIHYAEGIVWLVGLSILLDRTRRFILKSVVRRWLDGICGAVLIGLGARLALERQ
jgi:RhtB (resistance to homoserine/threonine) family protein